MSLRKYLSLLFFAAIYTASVCVHAQPLPVGASVHMVDSCLENWAVKAQAAESGDSSCPGARFFDLDGHLIYHIDTTQKLTKVDWKTFLPVGKQRADTIAKELTASLGAPPSRARNENELYWIWDNDEIHYVLTYDKTSVRLLGFEDQGAMEACSFHSFH